MFETHYYVLLSVSTWRNISLDSEWKAHEQLQPEPHVVT